METLKSESVLIYNGSTYFSVNCSDILFCQVDNSYMEIYLKDIEKPIIVIECLCNCISLLHCPTFFRINRKQLINLLYVTKIEAKIRKLCMHDGREFEISADHLQACVTEFSKIHIGVIGKLPPKISKNGIHP